MKNKIKYAYISTLESPQTYQYSGFFGKEFVDSYKDSRLGILNSLNANEKEINDSMQNYIKKFGNMGREEIIKKLSWERNTKTMLSVILYVQNKGIKGKETRNQVYELLGRFIKKYEVSKRIFSQYDADMKKIGYNYEDIDNYALLALNIALFCQSSKNLKFMNALLKINDMLCGMKDGIKTNTIPLFYLSLKTELDEIKILFKEKGLKL